MKIFFQNQRDDIGSARRSRAVKNDRRADRSKQHCISKLQKRLIGKWLFDRAGKLQNLRQPRKQKTAVNGADPRFFPQNKKAQKQTNKVDDRNQRRRRKGCYFSEQRTDTAHPARRKAVRNFEKINARREKHRSEEDEKIFGRRFMLFHFMVHLNIVRNRLKPSENTHRKRRGRKTFHAYYSKDRSLSSTAPTEKIGFRKEN